MTPLAVLLLAGGAAATVMLGALGFSLVRRALHRRALTVPDGIPLSKSGLLIRPCAGSEPSLFECLTSAARTRRSFPLRVVFGVDDPDDPAVPAVQRACEVLGEEGIEARLLVAPIIGPNRKASILAECVRVEGRDTDAFIVADSNVDLTGFDLDRLVRPLFSDKTVGALWVPFRETCTAPAWGNIASEAVLHFSWHNFGLLSAIDPAGMVGKLFAVRRDSLFAVEDFRSTTTVLGEDVALAGALRAEGLRVSALSAAVSSPVSQKSWGETVARHVRWMMVVKGRRPALLLAYPLFFFNSFLLYAAALIAAPAHPLAAASLAVYALGVRLAVGAVAARMVGIRPAVFTLVKGVFIGDILLLVAFVKTLGTRTFLWRGHRLRLGPGGVLQTVIVHGRDRME